MALHAVEGICYSLAYSAGAYGTALTIETVRVNLTLSSAWTFSCSLDFAYGLVFQKALKFMRI